MIIDSQNNGTVTSTGAKGSSMTVNITGSSFNFILDNLYTYPHKAIVRELSCNAWDAHVQAGNPEPFKIQVPSKFNPTLIIRDYGVGLNPEEIDLYLNTLYQSSKTTSNDQIGGFGLGAKSPFALVQSFFIISYKDHMEYKCFWYRDAEGIPILKIQSEKPTEEPNGLKYVISFEEKDIDALVKACSSELLTLPVQPRFFEDIEDDSSEFDLFGNNSLEILINCPEYLVVKDPNNFIVSPNSGQHTFNNIGICIGGVSYHVPYTWLTNRDTREFFNLFNLSHYTFLVKAPIGIIKLPSTREHILDIEENRTYISNLLLEAFNKYTQDIRSDYLQTVSPIALKDVTEHCIKLLSFCNKTGLNYRAAALSFFKGEDLFLNTRAKDIIKELGLESSSAKDFLLGHPSGKLLNHSNSGYKSFFEFKVVDKSSYRTTNSSYQVYQNITNIAKDKTLIILVDTPKFMGAWLSNEKDIGNYSHIYRCNCPSILGHFGNSPVLKKWTEDLLKAYGLTNSRIMYSSELVKPDVTLTSAKDNKPSPLIGIRKLSTANQICDSYSSIPAITKLYDSNGKSLPFSSEYLTEATKQIFYVVKDEGPFPTWEHVQYLLTLPKEDVSYYFVIKSQVPLFLEACKNTPVIEKVTQLEQTTDNLNYEHFDLEFIRQLNYLDKIVTQVPDQLSRNALLQDVSKLSLIPEDVIEVAKTSASYSFKHYAFSKLPRTNINNYLCNYLDRIINSHPELDTSFNIDELLEEFNEDFLLSILKDNLRNNQFLLNIVNILQNKDKE